MARYLLAMLLLLASMATVGAQSIGVTKVKPFAPTMMFSHLAMDMGVGIKNIEGTASVMLYIYTEEDFETALSVNRLGLNPKTNPIVKREVDSYMTRTGLADSSRGRVLMGAPTPIIYGRIDSIGDDYLLIRLDVDTKSKPNARSRRRRIIPKASIGAIDLDASPISFSVRPEPKPKPTHNDG